MASRLAAAGLSGFLCLAGATAAPAAEPATHETIVLMRHGEKPEDGLGQLSCQGLNRALALPAVLARSFPRPAALFAANPSVEKEDNGRLYNYVRPLATIEPTAVAFGLPVDASIGFADYRGLEKLLTAPALHDAVVFVSWEHHVMVDLTHALLADNGGEAAGVPDWKGSDFDSLWVVTITRTGATANATFAIRHQGLDGLPAACPG